MQIYIGMEVSYIDRETGRRWIQEAEEISRMLILDPHRPIKSQIKRL